MTRPLPKSILDNPRLESWFCLAQPGRLGIRSGKVELGQGILTALVQIAADELGLSPESIDMLPLNTAAGPDEWLTASSQSIETGGAALRLAAACLRDAALAAAASMLNLAPQALSMQQGNILADGTPTGVSLWSVAERINWRQSIHAEQSLLPSQGNRLVGQSLPRRDLPQILAGSGFLHDLILPNMLHGRVFHAPCLGASLRDVPAANFHQRYGDKCRLVRRGNFLALIAGSESLARQAAAYLEPMLGWDAPHMQIPEEVAPWLQSAPTKVMHDDPQPALPADTIQATYSRAFLLHGAIGPSCAVAEQQGDKLKIWCHSQGLFNLRSQIARVLGYAPQMLELEHRPSSGCYGHNGADDVALEAALLADAIPGYPVRVLWTRQDEMRATSGSAMVMELSAGLDQAGLIQGWRASISSGTHSSRPGAGGDINLAAATACDAGFAPKNLSDVADAVGSGALRNAVPLYDLPAVSLQHRLLHDLPLRTSSLRALGAHPNVFAIEGFIDELAEKAGCDPLLFRRRHLSDARALAVLDKVAEMANWQANAETSTGRSQGIGLARYKNKSGYCAVIAEVEVEEAVRVTRIWCAVDGGCIINPDGALNQIEGGVVQSISWSLKEAVRSVDGVMASVDWQSYPILRFSEVPPIKTCLLKRPDQPPLGLGEVSQGPTAAALGNAASRALGQRLRHLPLSRERLMATLLRQE
ncbi:molybdopterin cofactor-binding domain-containing protein [Ferrovibrio sp.]|uniref:xanthine dehydrogenase family protein molybdopterin-binding subunit n=1 Tax=Ferrovibrio sp. TaxID=1917215 RepID=UPI001B6F0444|nr:molybdopterin cofactor-binding domain-containing protein [Ferrovibrio sp.]MBP7065655.1 xanthine dehydrogenase family protein molybdopterin-binding subunit [Ferrovibrio sp.]